MIDSVVTSANQRRTRSGSSATRASTTPARSDLLHAAEQQNRFERAYARAYSLQNDLAGWSGQSREAVVKAFRALRPLGWIDVDGKHIILHDLAALTTRSQTA